MSRRPMRRDREHAYQGQGQGQAGVTPLFEQVLALAQGRPVFTADNVAVVGGKVVAFIDWNDPTHLLAQANSANQVAAPTSHADFAGALCATFAGAQLYQSNRPASAWAFASDGASVEHMRVMTPTVTSVGEVYDTTAFTGAEAGLTFYSGFVGATFGFNLTGVGGYAHTDNPIAAATANVPALFGVRDKAADAPQYQIRMRGDVVKSGPYVLPTAASAQPLTIASLTWPALSYAAHMRWALIAFFPALTDAQRAIVHAWIKEAYGIRTTDDLFQEVLAISAGRPVFTADNYAEVGGKVVGWIDHNDPSHMLSQASSARQVSVPAAHADFAGALCASFAGAQVYVSTRSQSQWAFGHNGVSVEHTAVFTPLAGGANHMVYATRGDGGTGTQVYFQNPPAGILHYMQATGQAAFVGLGTSTVGGPVYTSIRNKAIDTPQIEARNRSTVTGSGPYAEPPSSGPSEYPLAMGAHAGFGHPATMRWAALLWTPALTPAQRSVVQQWIRQAYGLAP